MKIYVDANVNYGGNGSERMPFRCIDDAAKIAQPGDEVLVFPRIYREYVNPVYGGTKEARITYPQHRTSAGDNYRCGTDKKLEII